MARRALGPATLAVTRAVAALPEAPWAVGCSGGADSLALAWAAHHVAGRRGTPVRAVVVDHGLQEGSDAVAARVVGVLAGFGLAADVATVAVGEAGGPEAAARDARLAALADAVRADGPDARVLLGHTLDDQAETVLLGLARGSGPRSLAGMAPARGVFLRPLLGVGREVTDAACAELGLEPWHDPHNADRRFARVRVREVVLPVLEEQLGPGIRGALARTAALAAADADVVDAVARDVSTRALVPRAPLDGRVPDCRYLHGLAPGLRRRVLSDWLRDAGASEVTAAHVAAVERLVTHWRGQKGVDVPGGRVRRRDGHLGFERG